MRFRLARISENLRLIAFELILFILLSRQYVFAFNFVDFRGYAFAY